MMPRQKPPWGQLLCLISCICGAIPHTACGTTDSDTKSAADAGTDSESVAEAEIGPQGGTLRLGELVLTVPPGALAQLTRLRILRTNEAPPLGQPLLSPIYRFEPEGLAFALPAHVAIPFLGAGDRA